MVFDKLGILGEEKLQTEIQRWHFWRTDNAIGDVAYFGEAGCSNNILSALQASGLEAANGVGRMVNVLGGINQARQGRVSSHQLNSGPGP